MSETKVTLPRGSGVKWELTWTQFRRSPSFGREPSNRRSFAKIGQLSYFDIAKSATDPLLNDSPLITPLVMVAAAAAAGAAPPTI